MAIEMLLVEVVLVEYCYLGYFSGGCYDIVVC